MTVQSPGAAAVLEATVHVAPRTFDHTLLVGKSSHRAVLARIHLRKGCVLSLWTVKAAVRLNLALILTLWTVDAACGVGQTVPSCLARLAPICGAQGLVLAGLAIFAMCRSG